ncbi:MAG: ABC transporter permease [Candidatus Eremiobacteraeota bacterium]|nr:ABC transporter permease [Candidatus Eremiobacteraeota bacterium]MBV8222867.1 ABC transporter permease [Candidatus Eremiobacteraeota bacterium]
MKLWEFFGSALETLWANRTRSILTMIGIVIGTAAVIAIFALGQSASSSIAATLGMFGDQGIFVFPDSGARRLKTVQLQWQDVATVRDACSRCAKVFPSYDSFVTIRSGHTNDAYELQSDTDYIVDKLPMAEGRRFSSDDIDSARQVADLLMPAKQRLFGDGPAVGKYVRIAERRFLVVGVYAPISAGIFSGAGGSDYTINIPYTAFHHLTNSQILYLQIFPKPGESSAAVIDDVIGILKRVHGSRAAFEGQDFSEQANTFLSVIAYVAIGISAIGFIALVVGGIGVMNIMLVSVIERTREIGIRKAIGASRRDIMWQFLAEAIAITLIGGLVGALMGVGVALAANNFIAGGFAGHAASINWVSILLGALTFSALIGLFFGTYPAARAASLSPIECLRHE